MMNWQNIVSEDNLSAMEKQSESTPVLIFKHSTTCSISSMAKMRLEDSWNFDIPTYYLDLLAHRSISHAIAEKYNVHHESPQILIIHKGECIYDASHFDITVDEIAETLSFHELI